MEKIINEETYHVVKLTGRANIPGSLKLANEYDLTIGGIECRKVEEVPNDDGTNTKIYNLRASPMCELSIISESGIIQNVRSGSPSQMQRFFLTEIAKAKGLDGQTYYEEKMKANLENLEKVLEKEKLGKNS